MSKKPKKINNLEDLDQLLGNFSEEIEITRKGLKELPDEFKKEVKKPIRKPNQNQK